jgi:sugar phosphate isomerase/epimerase
MKYAICNETFQNYDWAATCRAVADAGYDGIEVAPFTLADDITTLSAHARRVHADTARRAGLDVVGLHWLLVAPKGLSLTDADAAVRQRTSAYLKELVMFCSDLGGRVLVLGSPAQRHLPLDVPPAEAPRTAEDRLIACLEPALQTALEHGITLCLEPLPAPEADFILTLQSAVDILNRLQHPALRTIFDVKSACSEGKPLPELIEAYAADIAHVHANDANRRGPGFGSTDYVPVFSALDSIGYNGYVSVEVFDYTPDPITIARESLAYMRRCRTPGAAEGHHANG